MEARNIETVQMRIVVEDRQSFFSFTVCWDGESVAYSEENVPLFFGSIKMLI